MLLASPVKSLSLLSIIFLSIQSTAVGNIVKRALLDDGREFAATTSNNISDELEYDYKAEFDSINKYLLENAANNNSKDNMNQVIDWFERNLTKTQPQNQRLVEAVGNLIELSKLGTGDRCNKASSHVLALNDNGTEHRTRMIWSKQFVFRRIDELVSDYVRKYTDSCQPFHVRSAKAKYSQLDKATTEQVESLTDSFITRELKVTDKKKLTNEMYFMYVREPRIGIWNGQYLLEVLKSLAKNDPDRIYLNNTVDNRLGIIKPKVVELHKKYLVKPCDYYVSELEEIFDLADFDSRLHHNVDENDHDYYSIWARYHLCRSVVHDTYLHALLLKAIRNDQELTNTRH